MLEHHFKPPSHLHPRFQRAWKRGTTILTLYNHMDSPRAFTVIIGPACFNSYTHDSPPHQQRTPPPRSLTVDLLCRLVRHVAKRNREICGDLQSHPHGAFFGRFIVLTSIWRDSRQCDCQHLPEKLSPFPCSLLDHTKTLMINLQVGIPLVARLLDSDVFLFHPGHEAFINCFHGSTAPIGIDIRCSFGSQFVPLFPQLHQFRFINWV